MARPVLRLTEGELSRLIRASTGPHQAIETGWGNPVLKDTSINRWAYDLLLEWWHVEEIPDTAIYMAKQEVQ